MTSVVHKDLDDQETPDLAAVMNDIALIKRDLAALIKNNMKIDLSGEIASAKNVLGDMSEEVSHLYRNMAEQGERSIKAIGKNVEEQPVISLLLAFALGFIGGKLLSHRDQ